MNVPDHPGPFVIKDCALSAIATGARAQNLRELADHLQTIHPGSIYYHFWGGLLRPRFDDPEYNNDFAAWTRHALHDQELAERLGVIDPAEYSDLESLRQDVLEVLEQRLDTADPHGWAERDNQFYFLRSQIVVFDTKQQIRKPEDLAMVAPALSVGSIFYHFIDARRRAPQGLDDFRAWLSRFDGRYTDVCTALAAVDPYFVPLTKLRDNLASIFRLHFPRRKHA
jgi:hypothetical protein